MPLSRLWRDLIGIGLRRRTVQSYTKISRSSELSEGVSFFVSSEFFRSIICVASIAQFLRDLLVRQTLLLHSPLWSTGVFPKASMSTLVPSLSARIQFKPRSTDQSGFSPDIITLVQQIWIFSLTTCFRLHYAYPNSSHSFLSLKM